jgi:hypothetical protein
MRRSAARWGGVDPHEKAVVVGRVRRLGNPIVHHTYRDVADHLRAVRKLTAVATREVPPGVPVGAGRLIAEPVWRFLRAYLFRTAFLEGLPGFFVAATDAFYTFYRWACVWERDRGSDDAAC